MTRARVCARGCVGACVCEAGGQSLPGVWVCGARACVSGCTCVDVCVWPAGRLRPGPPRGGWSGWRPWRATQINTEQELKFYCRSHWLVDLVLSGFNTPYQIYRTKFIEYLNDTRTW